MALEKETIANRLKIEQDTALAAQSLISNALSPRDVKAGHGRHYRQRRVKGRDDLRDFDQADDMEDDASSVISLPNMVLSLDQEVRTLPIYSMKYTTSYSNIFHEIHPFILQYIP